MLRSLQRHILSTDQQLVLLAPATGEVPGFFLNVPASGGARARLLQEVQRLRGRVYLSDGALRPDQLSPDGLHQTPEDERAWHLLVLSRNRVSSCVWYLDHSNDCRIDDLRVRDCPLTEDSRALMETAVADELAQARRNRLRYVELGGWAVAPDARHTGEGLLLALAAYSLGRAMGGALGLTTATVRHASSTILRRLGGAPLQANGQTLPVYFDERYRCDMELLRFDSRSPSPKYEAAIDSMRDCLARVPVMASGDEPAAAVRKPRVAAWVPVAAAG